jgi:uncharacterized membrane protein YesL
MIRVLRLLRSSLSAWYYDLFILIAVNVVWLILSLSLIPIGPATAGLFYVANEVAKGEPLSFGLFWTGLKRFRGVSFRLALVLAVITVLIIVNIGFYLNLQSTIGQIVGIIWIYVLVFWAVLLNYPFALLVQMEKPGVRKILRNSALLALDNVAFTFSMSLATLLVIGLSIFPLGFLPFPFGFFALLAIFQCKAVAQLIEKYEQKAAAKA